MNNYRLYVIFKIPTLRVIDFKKITAKERKEAEQVFASLLNTKEQPKTKAKKDGN